MISEYGSGAIPGLASDTGCVVILRGRKWARTGQWPVAGLVACGPWNCGIGCLVTTGHRETVEL